jgi:hypothetical protein
MFPNISAYNWPKKCWGKNVVLTPINKIQKCTLDNNLL